MRERGKDPAVVLLADDDQTMRLLIRGALEHVGFAVEEAMTGEQAVAVFPQLQPDLVLLNVVMPGMDGFATCEAIRLLPGGEQTPILMVTGLGDTASILRAYEAGATDFIQKPVNWVILGQRARYMLRASRTLESLQRSEEKNRALLEQTRQVAEELRQFAYVASHDLQEPLRMVTSYVQLLAERYHDQLDAEAQEFIGYAVEGAQRMHALIVDLLAYSRVERQAPEWTETDGEVVVEQAMHDLRLAVAESRAVVTHDALPTVTAVPGQFRQLLENLLSNALKFRGPEPPRIHLSAQRQGTEWVFSVRDNGIGLDPLHATRIFQMFQRLHTHREYPGTGIGLAICKKIVTRHGGRIWVESELGKGATFFFTLPAPLDPERRLSAREDSEGKG